MGEKSEAEVLKETRVALSKRGVTNFRNNRGKLKDDFGRWVEFGLTNGASDIIGWRKVTITAEMVGRDVAVFVAVEAKRKGGRVSEDQRNFLLQLRQAGGIAGVAVTASEIDWILDRWMA